MRHLRTWSVAGIAALALAGYAVAQNAPATAEAAAPAAAAAPADTAAVAAPVAGPDPKALEALDATHWGDAKAGAAKAGACAACHGLDGNGTNAALYPRLAGLSERYIARQLALFKSGHRTTGNAGLMIPYANALSAQDMRDVGAYFATQKSGAGVADETEVTDEKSPYKGKKFYEIGQQLYLRGDAKRGIVACMACHGPDGKGNPGPAYPHISGQQDWYVSRRLTEYRDLESPVKDDKLHALMAQESKTLTDEEIKALGSYIQGLHERAEEADGDRVAKFLALPAAEPAPAPAAPAAAAPAAEAAPAATETAPAAVPAAH